MHFYFYHIGYFTGLNYLLVCCAAQIRQDDCDISENETKREWNKKRKTKQNEMKTKQKQNKKRKKNKTKWKQKQNKNENETKQKRRYANFVQVCKYSASAWFECISCKKQTNKKKQHTLDFCIRLTLVQCLLLLLPPGLKGGSCEEDRNVLTHFVPG